MSHGIMQDDKLVFTGATPWHGLGTYVPPKTDFLTWKKLSGFDWAIMTSPVRYHVGLGNEAQVYPDRFVMYRSDSGLPLSIASERFKPVQPGAILDFFRDLVATQGFALETIGTLKHGKYIWGLARVGKLGHIGAADDPVRAYLLLCTICEPGFATTLRFTSVRVVCNNTLEFALLSGERVIRIPHIQEFDAMRVKQAMGLGVSSFEHFLYQARKLASRTLTNEEALDFFMHTAGNPDIEPEDPLQPHVLLHLQRLYTETNATSRLSTVGTLWTALNTVTNYVDYRRPNRGNGGRLISAWFGAGAKMKEHAWSIAENFERTGSFEAMKSDALTV